MLPPDTMRQFALEWLASVTLDGDLPVRREVLANDCILDGQRFPLVDRGRGIRKPAGWDAAFSIPTAFPKGGRRPYDDGVGPDGLRRYHLRADEGGGAENAGLHAAMRRGLPLAWFVGIRPGEFVALAPVYLIDFESRERRFVVAVTEEQRTVRPGSVVEEITKRYLLRQTRQRVHQKVFAGQVMSAYDVRCAVCALHHRELLDAAHIIGDAETEGAAVVTNGLALCKIHHAAYDASVLGITPDGVVEVSQRLLDEVDGPMLRHGLQEHHGRRLMVLPRRRAEWPDPARLSSRYQRFLEATG